MWPTAGVAWTKPSDLIKLRDCEDPRMAAYLDSLWLGLLQTEQIFEAEEPLRQAASRESHDPTILSHLGDLLRQAGKDNLAEAQWQKSVR